MLLYVCNPPILCEASNLCTLLKFWTKAGLFESPWPWLMVFHSNRIGHLHWLCINVIILHPGVYLGEAGAAVGSRWCGYLQISQVPSITAFTICSFITLHRNGVDVALNPTNANFSDATNCIWVQSNCFRAESEGCTENWQRNLPRKRK